MELVGCVIGARLVPLGCGRGGRSSGRRRLRGPHLRPGLRQGRGWASAGRARSVFQGPCRWEWAGQQHQQRSCATARVPTWCEAAIAGAVAAVAAGLRARLQEELQRARHGPRVGCRHNCCTPGCSWPSRVARSAGHRSARSTSCCCCRGAWTSRVPGPLST